MPTRALGTICAIAQTCVLAITVSPAAAQGWNEVRYHRWDQVQYKARTKPKSAETEHASKEPFGTIPKGPVQIIISIDQQQLHLYSDGTQVANALVATGVPAHPTPVGVFSVIQKSLLHHSNIYSGAPMPYMQRITWSGVALHEGGNLGHPASHGCVRMPHDFATRLWVLTRLGARVIVALPELRPENFADPHLFVHKDKPTPPVPTASAPPAEKPIKTAQTVDGGKTIDAPAAKPDEGAVRTAIPTASEVPPTNKSGATDATPAGQAAAPVLVPVPPSKPIEIARAVAKLPISIFVSRKDKKIYVRQDFSPLFDAPIAVTHPDQLLGTHVFTAMQYLDDRSSFRWNVISLPGEPPKQLRNPANEKRFVQRRDQRVNVPPPVLLPPQTAAEALARIEIPADVIDQISQLIVPGSSLIVSDQGLGDETGEGTDFIVVTR